MADLVALQRAVTEARQEYNYRAATNTYGKTDQELVEVELAYRRACRALFNAEAALEAAIKGELNART